MRHGGIGRIRSWSLWRLPPRARRYVLIIDAAAVAVLALLASRTVWHLDHFADFAGIALCGVLGVEVFHRVGRPHRRPDRAYQDLMAAFLFPAVLLLPPFYAALIPLPIYLVEQLRVSHLPWVKWVFNASSAALTGALAALARSLVAPGLSSTGLLSLASPRGLAGLCVALAAFLALDKLLPAGVIRRVAPATSWRSLLAGKETWVLSAADVCSGVIVAVFWSLSPVLMPTALVPIFLLQRAVLHTQLVAAATTDSKTGLANPRYWREQATRVVARAQRLAEPAAVLVLDLDRFKSVNDRFGHLIGDSVLVAVADTLQAVLRPSDVVARFGGEEFVVLLAGAGADAALLAGERVRAKLAGLQHSTPGGEDRFQVTASIGLAVLGRDGLDVDQLLEAADRAMYQAKSQGGNRLLPATGQPLAASQRGTGSGDAGAGPLAEPGHGAPQALLQAH